ncbi:MAG: hypothetical protein JL50_09775 [Peptococcaceae bacterium BICA1-7]|nr:MAG: hypothetical protein JL50_09775 [Peptococcaceae bacterium BICA1-7]HBV95570.1 hypothetical protein [Desulfotomaculum sp.]
MYVAFYGRVSTEEQADRGNIAGQVDFARKYFSLHGGEEKVEGYGIYLDEGVSGTLPLDARPGGAALMADARSGKVGAVYFYRLDRLARSTRVVLDTYKELENLNVSIKSMTESFDTGTPVGKFFMTLLASIAALERDTILERTQMGKERKAREGCWTSGPPPFGYRIGPDKRLSVYCPEAETVRLIFRLYSGGMTMVPLAEYLNARDIPTPNVSKEWKRAAAGTWQAGHISIILRSTVYRGEYFTMRRSKKGRGGTVIKVPAIVTGEEFDRAAALMAQNGDLSRRLRGRAYPLGGLIYCGLCGRAMVGNSGGSGRRYYRCSGTVNRGRGRECSSGQVRAGDLERVIWEDIKEFIKNPGNYSQKVVQRLEDQKKKVSPENEEVGDLERAIAAKRSARSKVLSLAARSLVSEEEAERELQSLAGDLDLLIRRRDGLLDYKSRLEENRVTPESAPLLMKKIALMMERTEPRGDIIKLLAERVVVTAKGPMNEGDCHVSVYYRFKEP